MTPSSRHMVTWALVALAGAAAGAMAQPIRYVAVPLTEVPPMAPAEGSVEMDWTTIDSGGGPLTGTGDLLLEGTFGQGDAARITGGGMELFGGFWSPIAEPGFCYANCDESTTPPILNIADFTCFLQRFAGGEEYANCDESTITPVLNVADFTCFLQKFAAGCP